MYYLGKFLSVFSIFFGFVSVYAHPTLATKSNSAQGETVATCHSNLVDSVAPPMGTNLIRSGNGIATNWQAEAERLARQLMQETEKKNEFEKLFNSRRAEANVLNFRFNVASEQQKQAEAKIAVLSKQLLHLEEENAQYKNILKSAVIDRENPTNMAFETIINSKEDFTPLEFFQKLQADNQTLQATKDSVFNEFEDLRSKYNFLEENYNALSKKNEGLLVANHDLQRDKDDKRIVLQRLLESFTKVKNQKEENDRIIDQKDSMIANLQNIAKNQKEENDRIIAQKNSMIASLQKTNEELRTQTSCKISARGGKQPLALDMEDDFEFVVVSSN